MESTNDTGPSRTTSYIKKGKAPSPTASIVKNTHPPSKITSTAECSVLGDPQAAGLYKVRRVPHTRSRSRVVCCTGTPLRLVKCWAFSNLVISVLDLWFSICELVANTFPIKLTKEDNNIHWAFYLVSYLMHGDCIETIMEMMINTLGEAIYVVSSLLFAFATVLDKDDNALSRCLVQWFLFSEWVPLACLLPRFLINVTSKDCNGNFPSLFPQSNENAPRIAFWIINLLHIFFLIMWLVHGRMAAMKFLTLLKEVNEQNKQWIRISKLGSSENITTAPSGILHHAPGAGDRSLRPAGIGAMLPPSMAMV